MGQPEKPPEPTTEAWTLTELGYGDWLDRPIAIGSDGLPVIGRNFLDLYSNPESRQHTQDMLDGFRDIDPDAEPDLYAGSRALIQTYLTAYMGKPVFPEATQ